MTQQFDLFDSGTAPEAALFDSIQLADASLSLVRSFASVEHRVRWFEQLIDVTPWTQDNIVMFGRTMKVPRLSAWHGNADAGYTYSNIDLVPLPWNAPLLEIKALIEPLVGVVFNSVLVNLYRDGADSVAWHADDEPELGAEPVIASVSLGATRTFKLKHQTDSSLRHSMELVDGNLLIMQGRTQQCWMHAVPKRAKAVGPRINLTFRTVRAVRGGDGSPGATQE